MRVNVNLFARSARMARRRNLILMGAGVLSAIGAGTVAFIRYRRQHQQQPPQSAQ
jgi:hypothetical protein